MKGIIFVSFLVVALAEKKESNLGVRFEGGEVTTKAFDQLLEVEKKLISSIDNYVTKEKDRLLKLKDMAHKEGEKDKEYVFNPVNVFKLIKRMVNSELLQTLKENSAEELLSGFREAMPTDEALRQQAIKVFQLQDEKELSTKQLANGDIPGVLQTKPLNFDECFHLGRLAYLSADYYHCTLWMEETLERLKIRGNVSDEDRIRVYDYLSFSLYKLGNVEHAYWLTKKMLKMDPQNERAMGNIGWYEGDMKSAKLKYPKKEADLPEIKYTKPKAGSRKLEL